MCHPDARRDPFQRARLPVSCQRDLAREKIPPYVGMTQSEGVGAKATVNISEEALG
jgi:hypothetical protein